MLHSIETSQLICNAKTRYRLKVLNYHKNNSPCTPLQGCHEKGGTNLVEVEVKLRENP